MVFKTTVGKMCVNNNTCTDTWPIRAKVTLGQLSVCPFVDGVKYLNLTVGDLCSNFTGFI